MCFLFYLWYNFICCLVRFLTSTNPLKHYSKAATTRRQTRITPTNTCSRGRWSVNEGDAISGRPWSFNVAARGTASVVASVSPHSYLPTLWKIFKFLASVDDTVRWVRLAVAQRVCQLADKVPPLRKGFYTIFNVAHKMKSVTRKIMSLSTINL